MGSRRFRGRGKKRVTKGHVKNLFPDILLTKSKGHHIWVGVPCIDLGTVLTVTATANNTMSIILNSNPNGGNTYFFPGVIAPAPETYNPIQTYISKYAVYRPTGAKVSITMAIDDNGLTTPQIANPFVLYGFPCIYAAGVANNVTNLGNWWNGDVANGFTYSTVQQMKYGFKRISPGLGGKNMVKYTAYFDFAKIAGLTKLQYDSTPSFTCQPDENTLNPNIQVMLTLGVADMTSAQIRACFADIKITQYGRWEGQLPDFV